ncbi:MAG: NAD-dependent epimerase/dehydratase family protein [Candidatus Curtissbacteria bacterium]|nr:NAD-dependent epimerase/dehydratase family protein [Candidatus Curtissbacteria bacterium]
MILNIIFGGLSKTPLFPGEMRRAGLFKNKRVVIAGGAGFVGSNLINRLLSEGATIKATVHKKSPQIINSKIDYVRGDLTKGDFCRKIVRGADYVFMCAANTSGAAVIEKTPLVHVTGNIIMNSLMLEAAYEAKAKKFLFISSNTVYPVTNHPVRESEMMNGEPFFKYFPVAWMKRYSEILCEIYATKIKDPMNVVVVRPANLYGPYDDFAWETSHVVPALVRKVIERHNPIEVWGDGRDVKDLMYVDDFIEGVMLVVTKLKKFKPLNIGTGIPVSVRDVLKILIEVENFDDAKIVFDKTKPTMIKKRLIDVSLARRLVGFKSNTTLREGLQKTVEWYKQNGNFKNSF